jgi:hypothetical protein
MAKRDSEKNGKLMQKILQNLEQIAKAAKNGSEKEASEAVKTARESIRGSNGSVGAENAALRELDQELAVWQSKLPVIWKETVGRQGMAKHAVYWAEQLRNLCQTK